MRKYLFITLLLSGGCFQTFCQQDQEGDILKVDSLKKLSLSIKGRERIDCMVSMCLHYYDVRHIEGVKDSLLHYGNKVFNESKAISYKKGIAMGMLIWAPFGPDSVKEKNIREAIRIGEENNNDEVLGWGYESLLSISGDYQQLVDCYKKSIYHFHKAGNALREAEMSNWLSDHYQDRGENEKAFDYTKNSINLLKVESTEFANSYANAVSTALGHMSRLYSSAGDYENAMNYLRKAKEFSIVYKTNNRWGDYALDISGIFFKMGQYDSAMVYWNRHRNDPSWNSIWRGGQVLTNNYLSEIYLANKQYDKAIEILNYNIIYFDSLRKASIGTPYTTGHYGGMVASLLLGKAYDEKKNYKTALQFAKAGFNLANAMNRRPEMMQSYELLSSIHHHLGNNNSAYDYLLKYHAIKDSIQNKNFLLRIYNSKKDLEVEKKQAQLMLLDKDNKLKDVQLRQEETLKNFLIAVFIAFILLGIFVYRNLRLKRTNEKLRMEKNLEVQQLESAKKQAELLQRATELEMQALRAQMNPHFIFNCLSSINRFIFKNDNKTASDYLTRFSRLIRMVLMHSQKKLITLEDELEMLRLYLDLERLRFKDAFDYSITTTNIVDAGNIYIPPLLLQPFCENAVWHGLMHKETKGHLNVNINEVISEKDKILHCNIEDDGIGREKAAELKSKSAAFEKSMGLKITTERLALLNQENNFSTFYAIEDLLDENNEVAGTRVQVKIRYKERMEELV